MSRNTGVAFLIASTLFVSAQSADVCHGIIAHPEEKHYFQAQEDDHCPTTELFDNLEEQVELSYCKVRRTLLKLNSDPNYTFHPKLVEVRRCIGLCNGKSCLSTQNATRMVQVTLNHISGETKCGQVKVVDHLICGCS